MNNCIEILKTYPICSKKNDDILLCTASPEIRCLGAINKLDECYSVSKAIIIVYEHPDKMRQENLQLMIERLKPHGLVKEIKANETAIIPKIAEIVSTIYESVKDIEYPKITVDISTMIKWHLLLLLKGLSQKELLSFVRFLYTEPEDYILDLMHPLSFGNKGIFPVPFFQGNFDFSLETCLILMLGYEGQRAMAIFEAIDPEKCLLMIPDPPFKPEWKGRTEKMNQEIINLVGKESLRYIDARNPYKIKKQIQEIISKADISHYNHIFAPLGPKPQLLGLFEYYIENNEKTNIVYVSPLRHNNLYSEEIGKTWIIKERHE